MIAIRLSTRRRFRTIAERDFFARCGVQARV